MLPLATQAQPRLSGRRIRALALAHLGAWRAADPPLTTLAGHALVTAVLLSLVRDPLGPFPYALLAFCLSAALLALPFLGELGFLLREDEAAEWSGALPATSLERRVARALAFAAVLGTLALGSLVPAALLAPAELGWAGRLGLLAAGLGSALALGALLALFAGLAGRRAAFLEVLHGVLFLGLALALVVGLPRVVALAPLTGPGDLPAMLAFALAPAWFAAPFGAQGGAVALLAPLGGTLAAVAAILLLPLAPPRPPASGGDLLGRALAPLARLAARTWVRPGERAAFWFVLAALPGERETRLRTRPLLALPLLFVLGAWFQEPGPERDGLLALMLFAAAIYPPVILAHVPASASHRARWLLDGAPVPRACLTQGALKAVALRVLVPMYLALGAMAFALSGPALALGAAPLGLLFALAVLRRSAPGSLVEPPLSIPPERAGEGLTLGGPLLGAAVFATLLGALAGRWADGPAAFALLALPLLLHELIALFGDTRAARLVR